MPTTSEDMFTNVPVDLFWMGNASGPRLDDVRPQDVDFVDEKLANGPGRAYGASPRRHMSHSMASDPRLPGVGGLQCIGYEGRADVHGAGRFR